MACIAQMEMNLATVILPVLKYTVAQKFTVNISQILQRLKRLYDIPGCQIFLKARIPVATHLKQNRWQLLHFGDKQLPDLIRFG